MIRSLRRRHRFVTTVLALSLPPLFVAGLMARRSMPEVDLPQGLSARPLDLGEARMTQLKNTGSGLALRISSFRPQAGSDRPRLSVQLTSDPKRPELLVYWHAGGAETATLAADSYLLGALIGNEPALFRLPEAAASTPGGLIFYSLAQQEVVDRVALRTPGRDEDRP